MTDYDRSGLADPMGAGSAVAGPALLLSESFIEASVTGLRHTLAAAVAAEDAAPAIGSQPIEVAADESIEQEQGLPDQLGEQSVAAPPLVNLTRLQPVAITSVWPTEPHHFTPWPLDNADLFSEVLGLDVELESREYPSPVGVPGVTTLTAGTADTAGSVGLRNPTAASEANDAAST